MEMEQSINFWLTECENYDEYLNSFLSVEDYRYLQNMYYGRVMVELGYRSSRDVYSQKKFEEQKQLAIMALFATKKSTILQSIGLKIIDPVLSELAKREQVNLQRNVSTIFFVTLKLKTGFDISAYIDFEQSLRNKENGLDWRAIFSGKALIKPKRTDLSYYHWRTGKVINNDTDNYRVVNDRQYGLLFMYKGDRKFISVNHLSSKFIANSFRSTADSDKYGNVILFDHVVRKKI